MKHMVYMDLRVNRHTIRRPGQAAEEAVELFILKQTQALWLAVFLLLFRWSCTSNTRTVSLQLIVMKINTHEIWISTLQVAAPVRVQNFFKKANFQ